MGKINLHEIDKVSNKKNIDIFLEKIPDYPCDCKMFNFNLKENYADFELTKTLIYNEYNEINVYFRLKNSKKENGNDAHVDIVFWKSKAECHEKMRVFLDGCAAPQVYPSNFKIGDLAIGDIYDIYFIRGNVRIQVEGINEGIDKVVIENLAKEIDKQILDILTKQTDNKTSN